MTRKLDTDWHDVGPEHFIIDSSEFNNGYRVYGRHERWLSFRHPANTSRNFAPIDFDWGGVIYKKAWMNHHYHDPQEMMILRFASSQPSLPKDENGYHSDIEFRPSDFFGAKIRTSPVKGVLAHNKYCDLVSVGEFVQCSGTRDKGSWRKIIKLDEYDFIGQKYLQPIDSDEFMTPYMSENGYNTITNHVVVV